eukprot:TRINITY_DN55454_c0_g1_i1.p2 TRINITY_DN55454_c0_g1~~TRINITY_DN55454_c0_g1_i1.p2  ORF type:complete len:682 (+),score=243.58 TRINITY_DN55454_c0_g1_i1:107-2152(+)
MKMHSEAVPGTAKPGVHGPIRRSTLPCGPELSIDGVVFTMYENFQRAATMYPNAPCIGWRPIGPKGAGPYQWLTYAETAQRARHFGSGLVHLGCCDPNSDGLKLLGFYAKNRIEWVIGEQGCYHHAIAPVPLYDTLGAESVEYVVKQTELKAMCCSAVEVPNVLRVVRTQPQLRTILLMGEAVPAKLRGDCEAAGVRILTIAEVEKLGREHPALVVPPSPKDIAFFCYTSGTTGDPKGALISHEGIVSCLASVKRMGFDMYPTDVHLSYLPLPHVFERTCQMAVFWGGGRIGFYQGDTLKILEDVQELRPTIFPSVPRLLNRVYDKIIQGAQAAGGVKARLFQMALAAKTARLEKGGLAALKHPVWDALVFNPAKKRIGFDRVRLMVTGSAPIASHVMTFLRVFFGVPVHEGYGQTESSAAITFTAADDFTVGHVGAPLPCNETRLDDVPEMGYLQSDRVHGADPKKGVKGVPCLGRGEVVVRGPNVFQGYYRMEAKTKEAIDADGWLHTGDIGLWTADGKLKIIDRKKNIFKLAQGEYVAAEKIENIMTQSALVAQCFIYGDSLRSMLIAVVVPDPEALLPWAKSQGIQGDLAAICADSRTKKAVLSQLTKLAKKAELKGFEVPRAVHIEPEPFSVDNGMLTPTFKLKRNSVRDHYRQAIDQLYASIDPADIATEPAAKL